MEIILGIVIFFFGTIIGSFLNVVIYRFNSGKTIGGRSMCLSCGKTLTWLELIPIASFLHQRGKCTVCQSHISSQYPIVEAVTGFAFLFVAGEYAILLPQSLALFSILVTFYMFIWCLLIVISVYDIRHQIIPDSLVWTFNIVAFIGMFFIRDMTLVLHIPSLLNLFAGPIIALPFVLLWFFSKGKMMGLGDPKLMIGIGWLLGLSSGVAALMFAFWIGAIVSLCWLAFRGRKVTLKEAIPFGPFLVFSTFIVFLAHVDFSSILSWIGALLS